MILSTYLTSMLGSLLVIGFLNSPSPNVSAAGAISAPKPMAAHAVKATLLQDDVTMETCADCHEDEVASFGRTEHAAAWHTADMGKLVCSSCHGDPTAHLSGNDKAGTMVGFDEISSKAASELCMTCHQQPGEQGHARLSEHLRAGVACTDCHNVHPDEAQAMTAHKAGQGAMMPASEEACLKCHQNIAAEFAMPSRHKLHEGAMNCSSCHNVHGSENARQVREEGKEQCLSCHKDKRGPFMFEHEAGNLEGCTSCHAPHGAPGNHMLKMRDMRSLCLSCHSKEMGKGVPHGRASSTTMGDCTRCHSAVHGSNVDPFLLH